MSVTGQATGRRRKISKLAKSARGGIERLLAGLGWTWDKALSHAIDRCLELEEKRNDARR
jgi:hypothetical protein